ncbi:MAG: hypothetical protein IPF98_25155 [Gemmatimonadetes bacterium]|nr:hypothetical protein [Gemmatimonadota bacterium]
MPSRLVRSRRLTVLAIAAVALTGAVSRAVAAQVRVNPTGVNVNTQGSTTVFLTYGGLAGYAGAAGGAPRAEGLGQRAGAPQRP